MDSAPATPTTTEAEAKVPAKKKGYAKINLYVAFLIYVAVGAGAFVDMQTSVSLPLMSIATLLTIKYFLNEINDLKDVLNLPHSH